MCLCRLCFYLFIFVNKLNLQPRPSFESSRAELVEMDVVDWLSSAHKLYEEKLIHELECCEVKRLCQPSTCYLSPQPSSLPSSLRSLFFFLPTLSITFISEDLSVLSNMPRHTLTEVFPIRYVCPTLHVTLLL